MTGRFAPSPSGSLHLGNLRTALLAWCCARRSGGRFLIRMEDLTTGAAPVAEAEQLADLATLGLDHDGEVIRQSDRAERHREVLDHLNDLDLTYPCFCTRREIREAAAAPHGDDPAGVYPGTCAALSSAQRAERSQSVGRSAIRLRAESAPVDFVDRLNGHRSATVDDFVLARADGVAAYNLAVVVDDCDSGVDQVVRGDDLLATTHRQVFLQQLLGFATPEYVHVPLVLGPDGERLSKRHGDVGLAEQIRRGASPGRVLALLEMSSTSTEPEQILPARLAEVSPRDVLERFDLDRLSPEPWILDPENLSWSDS